MKIRKLRGTTLEGGGQLVRLSVCLSALTGRPIQIYNIRGNRDGGGGLKEQHLSCVKWLAAACNAEVEGMVHKSQVLTFKPARQRARWWEDVTIERDGKNVRVRETSVALATSGAVTLVLQAILPFLLCAGSEPSSSSAENDIADLDSHIENLKISENAIHHPDPILLILNGGTNVSNSPSIDYVIQILLPNYRLLGLPQIELLNNRNDVKRRRFSRGWATGRSSIGTVCFLINPLPLGASIPAITCPPRGQVTKFTVTILAPQDLREHLKRRAITELQTRFCRAESSSPAAVDANDAEIEVVTNEDSGHPKRLHVLIVAHTASGFRLGSDCLCTERVGKSLQAREEAANRLVDRAVAGIDEELQSGRSVDEWMEDQLVVFQALGRGRSCVDSVAVSVEGRRGKPASLHTRTVQWVASELLGVEFDDEGGCEGGAYVAGSGIM